MAAKMRKSTKKLVYLLLAIMIMVTGSFFILSKVADKNYLWVNAASDNANRIKVKLITMKNPTSVDITVVGTYSLQDITEKEYSESNNMLLRQRSYKFSIENNLIVISSDAGKTVVGKNVTLYSHVPNGNNYLTMNNPTSGYGICNYKGDMNISIENGTLVFVNNIGIEDYLCGVICREMSENQNIESLKVQAVCARSIAYNSVSNNSKYDVVDTTANQVYIGYNENYKKCIAAVEQTAYQVLTYNGAVISAYYSASNGGITESTSNAWVARLPYYKVQIDEFDNIYKGRVYTLSKTNIINSNRTKMKGYGVKGDVISIDSIVPTYDSEPASLPENQRRVQVLTITVTTTNGVESFTLKKQSGVCLGLYYRNVSGNNTTLPSSKYWIEETETDFIFHVDGNGHGIGMSQNGVYSRVAAGQKYKEILAFYYPGTVLGKVNYKARAYKPIPSNEFIDSDLGSLKILSNSVMGDLNDDVILYSNPGIAYSKIGALAKGERVVVVAETQSWSKISYGDEGKSAFILKKYFTENKDIIIPGLEGDVMKVGTVNTEVWVRSKPNYTVESQIALLPIGSEVIVISEMGQFYKIYYNDDIAYVSKVYVDVTSEDIYSVYDATVRAYKAGLYAEKNEFSPQNGYLPEGATIKVFNISYGFAGCIYKGEISYIKLDKIDILDTDGDYIVPRNETEINVNLKVSLVTNAYKYADENSEVIDELLENDIVTAIVLKDDWYKIVYGDGYAYVKAGDVVLYTDNIKIGYAQVIADKILYSNEECETAVVVLKANDIVQVIDQDGDIVMYMYNGIPCYADRENVIIKTEEVMIKP